MKLLLFAAFACFATAQSLAQSVDTTPTIRGCRPDSAFYYIDGIKVRAGAKPTQTTVKEINIITGGIPIYYGDINSSIIHISEPKTPKRRVIFLDKEQNLATE